MVLRIGSYDGVSIITLRWKITFCAHTRELTSRRHVVIMKQNELETTRNNITALLCKRITARYSDSVNQKRIDPRDITSTRVLKVEIT